MLAIIMKRGLKALFKSKVNSPLNSVGKSKQGVCYFLKSRLSTGSGTVDWKKMLWYYEILVVLVLF